MNNLLNKILDFLKGNMFNISPKFQCSFSPEIEKKILSTVLHIIISAKFRKGIQEPHRRKTTLSNIQVEPANYK